MLIIQLLDTKEQGGGVGSFVIESGKDQRVDSQWKKGHVDALKERTHERNIEEQGMWRGKQK